MVPFEELFDKIIDHETFLLHNDKQNSKSIPPTANIAKQPNSPYRQPKYVAHLHAPDLLPNPPSLDNLNQLPPPLIQLCVNFVAGMAMMPKDASNYFLNFDLNNHLHITLALLLQLQGSG